MNTRSIIGNASIVVVSIALGLTILGCSSSNLKTKNLTKVFEIQKQRCFGDCPVYTLTIYDNGLMEYIGEANTKKIGTYSKKLNINDLRKLTKEFRDGGFFNFKNVYRSFVPDLQTIIITFAEDGVSKTISGKEEGRPEELLVLEEKLEKIANSDGWRKLETKSDKSEAKSGNQILVEFVAEAVPDEWINNYARYELKLGENLSRRNNIWMVTFNTELIDPAKMLETIQRDPSVISAEMQSELNLRDF